MEMTFPPELQILMMEMQVEAAKRPEGCGLARHQKWRCRDGWIVGYTTERIEGGRFDGRFAAMAWKPVGKGAKTGKAHEWTRVYYRGFSTRKAARARAEALYHQHSK